VTDVDAAGCPEVGTMESGFGLFVIWPSGMSHADNILQDLARRFEILQIVEVHWSDHLVRRNYERFYSDLDVAGVYHELNKGRGPFLAIPVRDNHLARDYRDTSRGRRLVSVNLVDTKHHFRDRLGNIGVHCGENDWESERDLIMLLGLRPCELGSTGRVTGLEPSSSLHRDVTGARGWTSMAEIFTTLNPVMPYIAVDAGRGTDESSPDRHPEPVQIVTSDLHMLHTLIDGRPIYGRPRPAGGRFLVSIDGERVPVDLWPVDGGFIDAEWACACLESRILDDHGVYRAPPEDDLAIRAYLAVTRRRRLDAADHRALGELDRLVPPASTGDVASDDADPGKIDHRSGTAIVTRYLDQRGYRRVRPLDRTIVVHDPDDTPLTTGKRRVRAMAAMAAYRIAGVAVGGFLRVHQAAVDKLPGLRSRWRRWRYRE
jgi:hypothetical protein